jgi:hypothetical protein
MVKWSPYVKRPRTAYGNMVSTYEGAPPIPSHAEMAGGCPSDLPPVTGVSPTSKPCLGDCVARHVEVSDVTHGTGTVSEPATHDS